jgi:hypothetical protein
MGATVKYNAVVRKSIADSAAVKLFEGKAARQMKVLVRNVGATTCYIGDASVTAATGTPIKADETFDDEVALPFDGTAPALYAICDTGGSTTLSVQTSDTEDDR